MTTLIGQIETMRVRMNAMATERLWLVKTLDDQHLLDEEASAAPYYGHCAIYPLGQVALPWITLLRRDRRPQPRNTFPFRAVRSVSLATVFARRFKGVLGEPQKVRGGHRPKAVRRRPGLGGVVASVPGRELLGPW